MSKYRPKSVTADRDERIVSIIWSDDHESLYTFDGLRTVCPCVECKGGHLHMGQPADPRLVRDSPLTALNLEHIEAVGAYALQFFWSDGHSTGIYSWEFLRNACPCSKCLAADGAYLG